MPEPSRAERIKAAVRTNFDASPREYGDFERASGLFAFLTVELARNAGIEKGMSVADVGCGTGISTGVLLETVGREGRVVGIDLSPGMLEVARGRLPGTDFIEGDAESIDRLLGEGSQDAVLYTACVFLLPDAAASLRAARTVLREGGIVALNFIEGAYSGGRELFTGLFPEWTGGDKFPAPRFPCETSSLGGQLREAGFRDIRQGTLDREMGLEGLRRFYTVPAQSASLYPRLVAAERQAAVSRMFGLAQERGVRSASMRWAWIAGRK